tara:strand:+ start:321 stop:920 length:600 start_codon:yes stop_codon:yes gene_type:complete
MVFLREDSYMKTKIEKILNQKVKREDYDKFINSVYEKMDEESGRDPTFKECITIIKKLYRLIMGTTVGKYIKFKETSGRNHTWIRRGTWYINTEYPGWRVIIHSVSHAIEYAKHHVNRPHTLQQFRIEKECVEYAYKNRWHMGVLKRETKPKVVINKDVLMIKRLEKNISSWETKMKRAQTYIKKYSKKLKYYEKKINN